jgi:hypothetical protein
MCICCRGSSFHSTDISSGSTRRLCKTSVAIKGPNRTGTGPYLGRTLGSPLSLTVLLTPWGATANPSPTPRSMSQYLVLTSRSSRPLAVAVSTPDPSRTTPSIWVLWASSRKMPITAWPITPAACRAISRLCGLTRLSPQMLSPSLRPAMISGALMTSSRPSTVFMLEVILRWVGWESTPTRARVTRDFGYTSEYFDPYSCVPFPSTCHLSKSLERLLGYHNIENFRGRKSLPLAPLLISATSVHK